MSDLNLKLFGAPHFEFQGQVIEDISPQIIALTAYLAVLDQSQTRPALASLLLPHQDKDSALLAFDQWLQDVKGLLPVAWLEMNSLTVSIIPEAITIDVQQYISALTSTRAHLHSNGHLCEDCANALVTAIALYGDDFLAGFNMVDSGTFENWQIVQREWLKQECTSALRRLAEHAAPHAINEAIGYAQRWTVINPLDERAHRLLMRLYTANAQLAQAFNQYEVCTRLLNEALATPPQSETTELYTLIQQGHMPAVVTQTSRTAVFAAASVLPPLPRLLVGREDALRDIKARLGISSGETKQLLTVIEGWPGVGKSTTIGALAHDPEVQAAFPDGILWISLGEAPNLLSSLMVWVKALHLMSLDKIPVLEDLSKQISDAVRARRMLLIVDDVWQVEHVTPFRVGGANCGLIITSRLSDVAQALVSTPSDVYRLPVLNNDYALSLLARLVPDVVEEYPAESLELVHSLEGLPLAIQVAGRLLREEMPLGQRITDLLDELRKGSSLLTAQVPGDMIAAKGHTPPTIRALLRRSTDSLNEETLVRFALLSLFVPRPATFDLAAMAATWDVSDARHTARVLIKRGLIEPIGGGRFQMHALLVLHAQSLLREA